MHTRQGGMGRSVEAGLQVCRGWRRAQVDSWSWSEVVCLCLGGVGDHLVEVSRGQNPGRGVQL